MTMFSFFTRSDLFDHDVLRPLSHIRGNWELSWDHEQGRYLEEEDSYANVVNLLLKELEQCDPPVRYHDNEDRLAEYVVEHLKWPIKKVENRWVGMDYESILEQGGFHDLNETNLVLAGAGRIRAAITRGQNHFDDMEESHQHMLAAVITIILYHRTDSALE
jgi:hypothetical protein